MACLSPVSLLARGSVRASAQAAAQTSACTRLVRSRPARRPLSTTPRRRSVWPSESPRPLSRTPAQPAPPVRPSAFAEWTPDQAASAANVPQAKNAAYLAALKSKGEPIAGVTAYDYPSALACRGSDVDFALVGDSVANVVYGYDRTSDLSPEEMAISVRAVSRGIRHKSLTQTPFAPPLLLADLVFGTYEASVSQGMRAAIQLIRAGADGVKLEGGDEALPLIRALSDYGIPVMAHLGLRPQRAPALTGFRVQGSDAVSALQVLKDALAAQEAGAASLLIEAVPQVVGAEISKLVQIPAIGIGAGVRTDGQILVHHDLVGDLTSPGAVQPPRVAGCTNLSSDSSMTGVPLAHELTPKPARFVRLFTDHFPNAAESTSATPAAEHDASATGYALRAKGRLTVGAARLHAVASYVAAVKNRSFPASEEVYKMRKEERTAFDQMAAELLQKQGNTSA